MPGKNAKPERTRIGKIEAISIFNDPNAPYVVLFHGFGADADDLAPLCDAIPLSRQVNWVFPNGILEVPIGGGFYGRAWWPLDQEVFDCMMRGTPYNFATVAPPGLSRSRDLAFEMIRQLRVPWSQIVLGGFSQGAMLATELTLISDETPAGLVMLSGTLINQDKWVERAPLKKGLRFFQSHGTSDPILGYSYAEKLESVLRGAGLEGKLLGFRGQHEIPGQVLTGLGDYLTKVLPK